MNSKVWQSLGLILALFLLLPAANAQAQANQQPVVVLTAEGPLTPAMGEYISRGLEIAERENAALVILQLDTPGGSVDLMTEIVQNLRGSNIPIVVYVSPPGAIAGSAGTVITLGGHLSAMAPDTAIGAASPVGGGGEDIEETLETKIKEIIKAQIRSLAEGRPPQAIALAEDTVENAIALSAQEAFEVGLVDFIALDVQDLLDQLDGQTVSVKGRQLTLHTRDLEVMPIDPSLAEEVLGILTNPNIVLLLLSLGVQAILIELNSPGGWVAGFLGVLALSLAGYGLGVLPVNWFGLVMFAVAFVLFFLEIKAPTHGVLSITGILIFIFGALVLFNSPGTPQVYQVSLPLVVLTSLMSAALFITLVAFAIRAQQRPVYMGRSAMLGRNGRVKVEIPPYGRGEVQLAGELWTAELAEGNEKLKAGERVEVVAMDGLRLKVKKKS